MNKSCLSCVWSQFVIEKYDGLYSYEGDCHHYERGFNPPNPVHHIRSDDQGELRELVKPIFETTANNCEYYEQAGIGQPE
jgi:hypothetical protein